MPLSYQTTRTGPTVTANLGLPQWDWDALSDWWREWLRRRWPT